ncbi:MAG: hypothetical protein GY765_26295 [bacterium]|nr:hypothetical protein [bacterium]
MKVKKLNNKLSLNKKTIAHLSQDRMNGVNGGVCGPDCKCTCCNCLTENDATCVSCETCRPQMTCGKICQSIMFTMCGPACE